MEQVVAYMIGSIVLIVLIGTIYISNKLVNTLIFPTSRTIEEAYQIEIESQNFTKEWYDEIKEQYLETGVLKSKLGYELYYETLKTTQPSNKWVLFFHGYRFNSFGSYKYASMFQEKGYNLAFLDHTNCGRSGGKMTTMGYREVEDGLLFYNHIRQMVGEEAVVGIHGESMGAATGLLLATKAKNISFVIADCSYSVLADELAHQSKARYKLPRYPFIPIASLICKLKGGFFFGDIKPIDVVKEIDKQIPVFFAHGKEDSFTPPQMSQDMYNVKQGEKKIKFFDNAEHAKSYSMNKKTYIREVHEFLEKYAF